MNGDKAAYLVFCIVAAVFVGSSLIGRGLKPSATVKMILAWVAIFILVIWLFLMVGKP
ncbi:hypothetical protein G7078_06665 [Sphingomonas sinipercae]|uniref:Uncharacterized protein n=1 Tax=Sphingomonas sinipercae TaxID=2714944 RepID=A0A6G7ZNJ0_9SPHN|nr:hypothetical protein [Sphingomonas sinipercae]QIL02503.1 hypothetical protein G7078_06665 [Sphingomonas sinipercae]